jgi:hypothetical protein
MVANDILVQPVICWLCGFEAEAIVPQRCSWRRQRDALDVYAEATAKSAGGEKLL